MLKAIWVMVLVGSIGSVAEAAVTNISVSGSNSVKVSTCSPTSYSATVTRKGRFNNAATINLSSPSLTMKFYSDVNCLLPTLTLSLPSNVSTKRFYIRDSKAEATSIKTIVVGTNVTPSTLSINVTTTKGTPTPTPTATPTPTPTATPTATPSGTPSTASFPGGITGMGSLTSSKTLDTYYNKPVTIKAYHITVLWSDLQTIKGSFNWGAIDDKLAILETEGLKASFQIQVGPDSPEWVMQDSGGSCATDSVSAPGPYPKYMSSGYQTDYYTMLKAVTDHINAYSQSRKDNILFWQIAEGSTGDEGPSHGNFPAQCSSYVIDDLTWKQFRHDTWITVQSYQPQVRLLFNTENDGEQIDFVIQNLPGSDFKSGLISHVLSFDHEIPYFARKNLFSNSDTFASRSRGESQNLFDRTYWGKSPEKLTWQFALSGLAGGLDMLNLPSGEINDNASDSRPYDFFNKYSGPRRALDSNKGFSALREVLDFANTDRFPEGTYGQVMLDSDKAAYDRRISNINTNYPDQPVYREFQYSQALKDYLNPSRKTKIKTSGIAGAKFNAAYDNTSNIDSQQNLDVLNHDFGFNMSQNYEKFVTQIQAVQTTMPRYRVGANFDGSGKDLLDKDMYGRYAREFLLSAGRGSMYFKVDAGLKSSSGVSASTVTVTYYDEGNADWNITVFDHATMSTKVVKSIHNQGTKKFVQAVVSLADFDFNGKLTNGADITLNLTAGSNFAIVLLEFENTSKK